MVPQLVTCFPKEITTIELVFICLIALAMLFLYSSQRKIHGSDLIIRSTSKNYPCGISLLYSLGWKFLLLKYIFFNDIIESIYLHIFTYFSFFLIFSIHYRLSLKIFLMPTYINNNSFMSVRKLQYAEKAVSKGLRTGFNVNLRTIVDVCWHLQIRVYQCGHLYVLDTLYIFLVLHVTFIFAIATTQSNSVLYYIHTK